MSNFFSHNGLKQFLIHLKKQREITSFYGYNGSNAAILRHDVDLSIEMAYAVAKIEKQIKVISTFFFMITTDNYNILSKKNRQYIKKMSDWGFEIGLHFDPVIQRESDKMLLKRIEFEARILSNIADKEVQTISFHQPSITHQFRIPTCTLKNAYDPEFFSSKYYISDSVMNFKKNIIKFVENTQNHSIQILLHPLHYQPHPKNYADIFHQFIISGINATDKSFRNVNPKYRKETGTGLLDSFIFKQKNARNRRRK